MRRSDSLPDLLLVGHITHDRTPDGLMWGGAVTYGAITTNNLGLRPAVVTSVSNGTNFNAALHGLPVHIVPSAGTTTFINEYHLGRRKQVIEKIASPITFHDVPKAWRDVRMVLLAPVVGEVDVALAKRFPNAIVLASLQGWIRKWNSHGQVIPKRWEGHGVLPYLDAAIVSIADIHDEDLIDIWSKLVPILIITLGARGARISVNGIWNNVEAFKAAEVDATGAGDVFAASFLSRFGAGKSPLESAKFAACAASFSVEAVGTASTPTLGQIENRISKNNSTPI